MRISKQNKIQFIIVICFFTLFLFFSSFPPLSSCTCFGLAFVCRGIFNAELYHNLRYLDASGSQLTLQHFRFNDLLTFLDLSHCGLQQVQHVYLANLLQLDLSDNLLTNVSAHTLGGMDNLRVLSLSGNPLQFWTTSPPPELALFRLDSLDLSRVHVRELHDDTLTSLVAWNVRVLNMTDCGVEKVGAAFSQLSGLQVLDLRGNPVTHFPPSSVFGHLEELEEVVL